LILTGLKKIPSTLVGTPAVLKAKSSKVNTADPKPHQPPKTHTLHAPPFGEARLPSPKIGLKNIDGLSYEIEGVVEVLGGPYFSKARTVQVLGN
jgi:hypothetical protein